MVTAVHLEREARARAETGLSDEQWTDAQAADLQALADSGRFPNFAHLMDGLVTGYDFDLDALFDTGLRALLDGFERLVDQQREPAVTPPARPPRG